MPKKKKKKKSEEKKATVKNDLKDLNEQIAGVVEGLLYTSETDAEIFPFSGEKADFVSKEILLNQLKKDLNIRVEEKGFDEFFEPLIKVQDWFEADERKMTEKFAELKGLLQQNLIDKKVFRIGKKEIDIYIVGLNAENILCGVQTKAVET